MTITIISQYYGSLSSTGPASAKSQPHSSNSAGGSHGFHYPPSILMVADISTHLMGLMQRFENKNCQVYWLDPTLDSFFEAGQCPRCFDLIVLDLTGTDKECLAVYKKLGAYPELAGTPVIILTAEGEAHATLDGADKSLNYYLFETPQPISEDKIEAELWQVIEQIRYLAARYS